MKFCFLLGKTAAEMCHNAQGRFKDEVMSTPHVYEWSVCFKRGEMSVENQWSCGHPSMSRTDENVEKVHQAVLAKRRRTIDENSEIKGVSRSSCQCILMEDLMMKRVVAKFVPRLLTEEQKNRHVNVCCDL